MMVPHVIQGQPWSRRRWWWLVLLFFGTQVTVVYWLGERGPVKQRPAAPEQTLRFLPTVPGEWLALNDPTLFALPHRQGFSASAWLNLPELAAPRFAWTEDPRWLSWPEFTAGGFDSAPAGRGPGGEVRIPSLPPSDLPLAELPPTLPLTVRSRLRLEGPLAARSLLTPFQLSDPTNSDILTNTVIQMVVDALGRPRSFTLLGSSGLPRADEAALGFARTARFAPLPGAETEPDTSPASLARLAWGTLSFDWHTLPLPPTNTLAPP